MSDQAYVVMPVQAAGASGQNQEQVASAIQQSLHEKLHPEQFREPEPEAGPLKKVIAQQDSLYKYISWEDPVRTLGSYLGLITLLSGAHYLHPTQWALKIGATGLGAVSLVSLVSRSTKSNFAASLRPEYKQVPESTLNATLKDIHDLVQYSVVQVQKIIFGEDLSKTFGAFVGLTALYWLVQIVSPFGLAILGLTLLYLAPLIASPRGREIAQDAKVRAQELADVTAQNAKSLAHDGKAKAADLSSQAQQTAANAQQHVGDLAQSGQRTAANLSNQTRDTAVDLSDQARGTASNFSDATTGNARRLPSVGANPINNGSDTAHSTMDNSQQYVEDSRFGTPNGNHDISRSTNGGQTTKVYPNVTVDGTIPKYDQTRV